MGTVSERWRVVGQSPRDDAHEKWGGRSVDGVRLPALEERIRMSCTPAGRGDLEEPANSRRTGPRGSHKRRVAGERRSGRPLDTTKKKREIRIEESRSEPVTRHESARCQRGETAPFTRLTRPSAGRGRFRAGTTRWNMSARLNGVRGPGSRNHSGRLARPGQGQPIRVRVSPPTRFRPTTASWTVERDPEGGRVDGSVNWATVGRETALIS